MNEIKIELAYQWKPILTDEHREYFFPDKITHSMKTLYKRPAIYRWNIFKDVPEDEKRIYIGEAQELCPQRINGYLNPGASQQTNKRIKEIFLSYLNNGLKIRLEWLQFEKITINDFILVPLNLSDKHVRRLIEEQMIIIYKQKGFEILNL